MPFPAGYIHTAEMAGAHPVQVYNARGSDVGKAV